MTFPLYIKRICAPALALLLLIAVAGPVCLVLASSAMAMPMGSEYVPCDSPGSAVACPYLRPDATVGVKAPSVEPLACAAILPPDPGALVSVAGFVAVDGESVEDPPPASQTPLRI